MFFFEIFGLIPHTGFVLFVINFEARRNMPSPPIVTTKSAQFMNLDAIPNLEKVKDTNVRIKK